MYEVGVGQKYTQKDIIENNTSEKHSCNGMGEKNEKKGESEKKEKEGKKKKEEKKHLQSERRKRKEVGQISHAVKNAFIAVNYLL